MQVVAVRSDLSHALSAVSRAISSRSTLPILSNVLLQASNGRLALTTTDLDTSIRTTIASEVAQSGAISVPANVLGQVVGSLPGNEVHLELQDSQLGVRAGKVEKSGFRAEYSILTLPAEEFPSIPEVEAQVAISIPEGILRNMIRQTIFSAAREEWHPILSGVLFEVRGNVLRLVATDQHRLALRSFALKKGSKEEEGRSLSVIIPGRPVNEVARLLKDTEDPVEVRVTENQVAFCAGDTMVVSRVIDGQFPAYEKVIPKEPQRNMRVGTQELLSLLKRVAIVARQNNDKAVFSLQEQSLIVRAESREVGTAEEELAVKVEGEPVEIAFNVQFLIDALNVLDCEETLMELSGTQYPGVLKKGTAGEAGEDFLYVVMPMQIIS